MILLVVLLIMSGWFSGIETALMSITPTKVKALVKQGRGGAKTLESIKQNQHHLIITILIGNNLVNIGAASLATVIFTKVFGASGVGIATGIMTFLVLVFGEITPKTIASNKAEAIGLFVAKPVSILMTILFPVVKIFELLTSAMTKIVGGRDGVLLSDEELRATVDMGTKEGLISSESAEIVGNVLDFESKTVEDVMTTEGEVVMFEDTQKVKEILPDIVSARHSRFPIYEKGDRNEIIGILDIDDVLEQIRKGKMATKVKTIKRPVQFVTEYKEVDEMLTEFHTKQEEMAVVVDEYGDVLGVVTEDDIMDEIVGDVFTKTPKAAKGDSAVVDGKESFSNINKQFNITKDEESSYRTVSGFIQNHLRRIPKKDEVIKLKTVNIQVISATAKEIRKVRITRK